MRNWICLSVLFFLVVVTLPGCTGKMVASNDLSIVGHIYVWDVRECGVMVVDYDYSEDGELILLESSNDISVKKEILKYGGGTGIRPSYKGYAYIMTVASLHDYSLANITYYFDMTPLKSTTEKICY